MAEYHTPFKLQILASDHMVYDGEASYVNVPTSEGNVAILAHHSNLIMAVNPGIVEFDPISDKYKGRKSIIVSFGILKVENGEAMLLVGTAERPEDIDEARALRAAEKAREDLKRANTNRDIALVNAELSKALNRIKGSRSIHKF